TVFAQNSYPSKPVRIVVGFSAGGTTDVVARIMAKELTQSLGQSFIIENRPGGGSNIATEVVKAADPDGYTLLFVAVTSTINQTLYPKIKFDLNRDFEAVALGAKVPNILVVHPSVPANNVKEFIEWARANDDKIAYASSGSGTSIHMAGEMFKVRTGLKTQHVPYKGSAPSVVSLVAGETDFGFLTAVTINAQLKAGNLRALAVAHDSRLPAMPDVPTMNEAGLKGFMADAWFMAAVPAGTPQPIVDRLYSEIAKILPQEDVKSKLDSVGVLPAGLSPKASSTFLRNEIAKWNEVVKTAKITLD
ncbi:MAG: tripartite tricarboxylate transporter substrate binding protein, partial [Comamonas sp.]